MTKTTIPTIPYHVLTWGYLHGHPKLSMPALVGPSMGPSMGASGTTRGSASAALDPNGSHDCFAYAVPHAVPHTVPLAVAHPAPCLAGCPWLPSGRGVPMGSLHACPIPPPCMVARGSLKACRGGDRACKATAAWPQGWPEEASVLGGDGEIMGLKRNPKLSNTKTLLTSTLPLTLISDSDLSTPPKGPHAPPDPKLSTTPNLNPPDPSTNRGAP